MELHRQSMGRDSMYEYFTVAIMDDYGQIRYITELNYIGGRKDTESKLLVE